MKNIKSYWIKKRINPQFSKPYYSACGQLGKREAKKKEETLYGMNFMLEYKTEKEYLDALKELREQGFTVHG